MPTLTPPPTPGTYLATFKTEHVVNDLYWYAKGLCIWNGTTWKRVDGGPLRWGVDRWEEINESQN